MISYVSSELLEKNKKIKHRFFNKSCELSRDDQNLKQQKLEETAKNIGVEPEKLITLSQIHSSHVVLVEAPLAGEVPKADALITQTPGLFIGVLTADCLPILLASKDASVVAAVHAGWRGAVAGIIENTVSAMLSLGASDIVAALGPCIWQESYEVSNQFYDQIDAPFFMKKHGSDRWHFDLPAYATTKLYKAGVLQVGPSMANTYSDQNFNSYRRVTHNPGQELKSNLSVIGINQRD